MKCYVFSEGDLTLFSEPMKEYAKRFNTPVLVLLISGVAFAIQSEFTLFVVDDFLV